jgi:hypothetical protein
MNTFFISNDYIKSNSLLDTNIDDKILKVAIIDTQEQVLMPAIGSSMYYYLVAAVMNKTLDELHQWLMINKIWPVLLHGVQARILKYLAIRYTNAGIEKMDKNNATAITAAEMNALAKDRDSAATFHLDLLIRYLTTHSSQFPEWLIITPDGKIPEVEQSTVDFYYDEENGPVDFGRRSPATYGLDRIFL